MTSTANPDLMSAGDHRRQTDEKAYALYLAEGQAEADAIAAEHELQRRRDAFTAEVLSDPLLREGSDVAAVELLRVMTTDAVRA